MDKYNTFWTVHIGRPAQRFFSLEEAEEYIKQAVLDGAVPRTRGGKPEAYICETVKAIKTNVSLESVEMEKGEHKIGELMDDPEDVVPELRGRAAEQIADLAQNLQPFEAHFEVDEEAQNN